MEQTYEFVRRIVDMQKRIESLEERLSYLESNKSAAEDIAHKVRKQLQKQELYRQAKTALQGE